MRPALKSGLLPVWRDRDTLQIGIDPRRAIALSGMGQAAFLIGLLDGSRDRDQVIDTAAGRGISPDATERVLTLLAAGGALDDFPASTLRSMPAALRTRFARELATTSLARRDSDGGARSLARRRAAVVAIEGDRRLGRAMARVLSAAGVGRVRYGPGPLRGDPGTVRSGPGAVRGDSGAAGGGQAAGRGHAAGGGPAAGGGQAAGGSQDRPARGTSRASRGKPPAAPDLVILAGQQPADRAWQLTRGRVQHLAVSASEAIGIVGPLVVPGRTACLSCLDYVRAAGDPAWPLILAQIRRRRPEPAACDAVLAAAVAAQAAAQALTAIEATPLASAAVNGTLELVLPDWRWRRRTWRPHPSCPCASHAAR